MKMQYRLYDSMLSEHLSGRRQMAFVSGPRQVGKTTTCRNQAQVYLNWDNTDDRKQLLQGPAAIAQRLGLDQLNSSKPVVLFDELHKFPKWKQFLKGFFDTYADQVHSVVTGSSRMDIYRRGGDSLMGRYFLYRMHPFTIAEILDTTLPGPNSIIRSPQEIAGSDFDALWTYGGYPEPYLKRDTRFGRQWQNLRLQQLLKEDIRDLTKIAHLDQLETLVNLLRHSSGTRLVYSNLANEVQISIDTARRWINTLCSLHFGFLVKPWFKNISRSLRKEPKWFLRDWAGIEDPGQKAETFVACHLLKAVEGWNDMGLGDFQLGYIRDVFKREVDFIVIRDRKPWFLAEVKTSDNTLSPTLTYYQEQLKVPFAFQVVLNADYIDTDCFAIQGRPVIVPAKTFLSQLL
jgi:hypothetical protein